MKQIYTPTEEELEVIRIMQAEKTNWEEGLVWVTDKIQFVMSNVVKKARKNYLGFFNQQKDPITKREKIFIPLTEWTVETMLKNIDVDTKDIDVKATNHQAHLKAQVFRQILKKKLDDIDFGKTLNSWLRRIAIDGTAYLKAYEIDNKLQVRVIDDLNIIADPSVECLNDSSGKTERNVISKPEFDELGLDNYEMVEGTSSVDRTSIDVGTNASGNTTEIPYVELFERYGYLPEFVRTGKEEDRNKYFYAHSVVSGLNGTPVVHLVEEVDDDPYGEGKLKEVPNRRAGRGIGEMLFSIQAYLNEVVNTRMNKARIVQLGLFKMKGNITPQQFKRLFTTGGIKLDASSDIEVLETGSIDPSSYKDEEQAYLWGNRVTGTTNEDEIAGNRPATNALIEERGAGKGYGLRIEGIMLELGKFIQKKMIPIIKKELKKDVGQIKRITGDPEILEKLDRAFIENKVYSQLESMTPFEKEQLLAQGITPETLVEEGVKSIKQELGNDRYIPIVDELLDTEFDVKVTITDESINRSVMAKMLQDTMGMLSSAGLPIRNTLKELYDTLGLDGEHLIQDMPMQGLPMLPQAGVEGAGSPAQMIAQQMPQ